MRAHFGYKDGSGDFFITIDTDKCDGCGDCIPACPAGLFQLAENEFDLDAETPVAVISPDFTKKIKYACGPCKPASGYAPHELPCVSACPPGAIIHSW